MPYQAKYQIPSKIKSWDEYINIYSKVIIPSQYDLCPNCLTITRYEIRACKECCSNCGCDLYRARTKLRGFVE